MSRPPIQGELVVVALKAEKLDHKSPIKQDPFCVFRIGDIVKKTKLDYGGALYPIWDDQVNIPVTAGCHELFVQIFDKTTQPNNLMADGVIDLGKVFRDSEHDGYFPLMNRGRPGGSIYLELTFYPAANTSRPQQQIRYQQPVPMGGNFPPQQPFRPPPPQQQHRPPPQQHRPPPPQQFRPPPQQPRPPQGPPQSYRPGPPLPQPPQNRPPPQHFGSQPHFTPYNQSRPLPQTPGHPMPHPSMGPSPQFHPSTSAPLLSSSYNPIVRPNQANYPQQPPYQGYHPGNHGGFPDPGHQQQNHYPRPMHGYNPQNQGYPPY